MQNKQDLERISHRFDSYIKKVLKNYRTDYIRKNIDRWENECFLEELEFSRRENLMKTEPTITAFIWLATESSPMK